MQKKHFLSFAAAGTFILSATLSQGQTWEEITTNVPGVISTSNLRPIESDGTRFYVLGKTGVYYSQDNGATFAPINDVAGGSYSLTNMPYRFMKYVNGSMWIGSDPGSGAINFGYASLHRLTPGQTVWQKSSSGFPIGTTSNQADDIAYDPTTGTYYAAAAIGGMFVSSDGLNWAQSTSGFGGTGVPATVVAFNGMAFADRGLVQVCKSVNQGATWTALNSHPGVTPGILLQLHGRVMFAIAGPTTPQDGLYYTDDNGATWNFSTAVRGSVDLTTDGTLIYAGGVAGGFGGRTGIKFSANTGDSWDNLPTDGLPMNAALGFNAFHIVRQGNYLFLHGSYDDASFVAHVGIFRLDVSGVDLRPSTQFLKQPALTNNYIVGETLNLSAQAVGLDVTYQWLFNGTNINGATSTNLSFGPLKTNDSGVYTIVATGDRNIATSSNIVVRVVEKQDGIYDITYHNPTTGGQTFVLPDGSMIAVNVSSIFKFSPNGTLVASRTITNANFTTNFVDSANRLIVTSTTTLGVNRIRRINISDLTDDPTFDQVTTERYIASVAELPGRGYVVGGWFTNVTTSISTNTVNQIFLVDYSGVVDQTFPGGPGPGITYTGIIQINKVMVVDTNIYVTGSFNLWNGQSIPVTPPFRLYPNGTFNTNFSTLEFNGTYFYTPYPGGKIFLVNGNSRPKIVNADGSLDASFNPSNLSFNIAQNVTAIAVGESNKIYIAGNGEMTTYAGQKVGGKYLRLNADGSFDSTFICTNGPSDTSGFTWVSYDPRGYIYLTRATGSGTFQGQSFGRGPYRLFAGANVTATTTNSFNTWAAQFSFPPGQDNPEDDPDGDGIKNVFEYYFGSNPTSAASGNKPLETTVNSGGQNYPALTFIRSKTASGVTLIPQASTSLSFTNLLGTTIESAVDLGDGTERVTIRSTTTIGSQPSQFLRILLSEP